MRFVVNFLSSKLSKGGSRVAIRLLLIAAIFMGSIVQANVGLAADGIDPAVTELGLFFKESFELGSMPTAFTTNHDQSDKKTWRICTDIDDKNCTDASHISGTSNWDICNENSKVACVAEVWAVDSKGQKFLASLLSHFQMTHDM